MEGVTATLEQFREQLMSQAIEISKLQQQLKLQSEEHKIQMMNQQQEIDELRTQINELKPQKSNSLELSCILVDEESDFKRFLHLYENSTRRQQRVEEKQKLKNLYEIYHALKDLDEIGKKNEKVFELLEYFFAVVKLLSPPSNEGGGLFSWWSFSATQRISLDQLKEKLISHEILEKNPFIEQLLEIVQNLALKKKGIDLEKKDSSEKDKTDVYVEESDINQIKEHIQGMFDNSGIEKCDILKELIPKVGGDNPVQFIEDHLPFLIQGGELTEEESNRLKLFAETFIVGDDWVSVGRDIEGYQEPGWFSWTCSKIKSACTLYGKNKQIDYILDSADEYKSTCSHIKYSIEWIYFGGRMMVDPTGAVLSLLW